MIIRAPYPDVVSGGGGGQRRWTPADMQGLTDFQYITSLQGPVAADFNAGTPVQSWNYIKPSGGAVATAAAPTDAVRPAIGSFNGLQSVYFDGGTRALTLSTSALLSGTADKFFFVVAAILEARTGDYYAFGQGSNASTGTAYKTRQGQTFLVDIGNNGFAIGSVPIATTGISIIVDTYKETGSLTRAWYNGQASATQATISRPLGTNKGGAIGYWPEYGARPQMHFLRAGRGYGIPSDDDLRRLEGWSSWDTGDNGASLPSGHPYKSAPPMVTA